MRPHFLHFNFENAASMSYLALRPPEYYYKPGNEEWLANFTQIASIELKEKTEEKMIEAIRYFERFEIVRMAGPNGSHSPT